MKRRLFVDLDGTLAEFRKIDLHVSEFEDASVAHDKLYEVLMAPQYFRTLRPHHNVIEAIKQIIAQGDIEVYSLSVYISNCDALKDKNAWMDEFLPELDSKHRIFVPEGSQKIDYIPETQEETIDCLLDDYTHNLEEWKTNGGLAIKLMNDINGTKGTWTGPYIQYEANPVTMICDIDYYFSLLEKEMDYDAIR